MRLETEFEERCSAEEQQLETEGSLKEIRSEVIYTRAFLLSVKESAACKRLPTGFESSNLSELLSTASDSDGDSRASNGRWDNNLEEKESHSRKNYCSDSWRHDCPSQCLSKAPGCASGSCGPMIRKDGAVQLTKSNNPYRPPHSYKFGEAKFEASSIIRKTNRITKTDCGSQEETHAEKHNIAQQPESKDSSDPIPAEYKKTANLSPLDDTSDKFSGSEKSSGKVSSFFKANVARRVDLLDCDADKVNESIIVGASSNEHCRAILNEHGGISLKDKSVDGSFTEFEKAIPLALAAPCEFEMGDSGNPLLSMEGSAASAKPNQALQLIPKRNELNLYKTSSPVRRDSLYTVSRSNTPETCGFPLIYGGGNFLTSVIGECGMTKSDDDDLRSSKISGNLELENIEENQSTFDNFWAEISAILRSEQELEPTPLASNKGAVDSEVHICLPDEDSLISIDNLTNTKSSNSNTADNYTDIADSEAEISLPEEDSLITVEDLIAPRCSKSTRRKSLAKDLLKSNLEVNAFKKSAGLDAAHNDERSSVASAKVPPCIDIAGSEIQQRLHSSQSYPQNPCTGFSSQKSWRPRFMDPKSNLDLYCNSCTCVNHVHSWRITPAKPTNFDCLVQYSVTEQPTNFSQQESGSLSSGLNCTAALTPGPALVPMLSYPPGVGEFNDQMPFYRCMDMEQGASLPWPGGIQ